MKTSWEVRAERFARSIYPYIARYVSQGRSLMDAVYTAVLNYNADKHRNVRVSSGACRVCLITSDYVIKMDYNRRNCSDFGGCYDEYNTYLEVTSDGYGHLLAECSWIHIDGAHIDFLAMERVRGVGKTRVTNWTEEEERYIRRHIGDLHRYNYGRKNGRGVIIDYACNRT